MIEEWIEIVGYDGKFSVSNTGKICNKNNKILKQTINPNGYYQITVRPNGRNGKCKSFKVHREVAKAFISNPENKPTINHIDGNKLNNNVSNLEWNTHQENAKHAYDNNIAVALKGIECSFAKLTDNDVKYIRKNYIPRHKEFGCRALARTFNISHPQIIDIIKRNTWKHII